jgi:hypothetical protein
MPEGADPSSKRSGHPIDRLIRELVGTGRSAEPDEVARILDRIATADFDERIVRIPPTERGIVYGGRRLLPWDDSLFAHLVRRVIVTEQWAAGTTAEQFVGDLRSAARDNSAALVLYLRRGGAVAGVLILTDRVVSLQGRGRRSLPELFVAYSADRGIIVTGYQVSSRESLAIPGDAVWLRQPDNLISPRGSIAPWTT